MRVYAQGPPPWDCNTCLQKAIDLCSDAGKKLCPGCCPHSVPIEGWQEYIVYAIGLIMLGLYIRYIKFNKNTMITTKKGIILTCYEGILKFPAPNIDTSRVLEITFTARDAYKYRGLYGDILSFNFHRWKNNIINHNNKMYTILSYINF